MDKKGNIKTGEDKILTDEHIDSSITYIDV